MKIRYLMVSLALAAVSGLASAAPLAVSEEERQLLGIQVEAVTLLENAATGSITMRVGFSPDAEWVIKTPFSGVLHRALVQQGDRVKAGDPLVVIRSPEFVALQRDYLKAGAELRMAEAASKRDQRLGEAGSISDRRRQETRYQYDSARADFAGLEGQLAMAGFDAAALKKLAAEAVISPDLVLTAPADAVVLDRQALLGTQLDGSEPLVSLGEPDKLVLNGVLSRSAAERLREGMRIHSEASACGAVIVFVSSVIDPLSQTVTIRAVPDSSENLSPGQLMEWQMLSEDRVLLVPSAAVVRLNDEDVVYVAVAGGFEARSVTVRSTSGGAWIVLDGLQDGDRIATRGTAALKGMSLGMGGGDA
ncbi:MAG: efflux RND transporter periplasmic adaptor subunit [Xanthomonadales bacterium]|nr:efflux RND transporter periplasmic adaptor subunit [Xanthomonadales bacterium]